MCGILGFINYPKGNIEKAQKLLFHRGPDEQTSYGFNNVNLVHTRLSIQDVKNGSQPFLIGDWVIVFNGEIYNHLALRSKVSSYTFQTQSDTETFLALYIELGIQALSICDGMFAFAILDQKSNTLILGRDRAGKKPLYYFKDADSMVFASELNTLSGCVNRLRVDEKEIYSYIRNGFFYHEKTPFQNVYEVSPGSILTVSITNLVIQKKSFFNILDYYKKDKISEFESAICLVDECLHKSVKDRLLSSDLEVGAFLSGGIDSSLVVAVASQYVDKLKTFTVKFDGAFDESKLARLTAEKFGTDHTEIHISMNLKDDIEKILWNYGEPFMDSSAVPSYYVSKEAKKHVSVVLNGDGADELFGGYRRYVPLANNWIGIAKHFSKFANILPKANNKKSNLNYIYRLLKLSKKQGLDFYNSATNDIFEDIYSFNSNNTFEIMEDFISGLDRENISALSKMLIMDFNCILPSDLLKKMDIATMSQSLEGRSPFLSKYMLELSPTLNDKFKVKGLNTKVILRELGKKYIPDTLVNQPKRGFEVPLKQWVNGELSSNILDSLNGDCYSKTFFPKGFVDQLIEKKIDTSEEKRAKMLWSLFCLEMWKKNLA
jgi:asparagine synthase (glutamine-hydrolysing)